MKKTLTAIAAIAALGTGIITAQAEPNYIPADGASFQSQLDTRAASSGDDIFLTSRDNGL